MLRICDWTTLRLEARRRSRLKPLAVAFAGAVFLFVASVHAAPLDFAVVTGNYDSALDAFPDDATNNWLDTTQSNVSVIPVSVPSATLLQVPAAGDDVFVRNGGTMTISSASTTPGNPAGTVSSLTLNVGFPRTLVTDDGVTIFQNEVGGNGTVNMTGGTLLGSGLNGLTLRLGGVSSLTGNPIFTGKFNQSGGVVNLSVSGNPGSIINIGSQGAANTPTSEYVLSGTGQINMADDAGNHVGINVRNGIFTMTGGTVASLDAPGVGGYNQRFLTISSTSGPSNAQHNVSTASIGGNAVVDVHNGIRVAPSNRADGYLTVSGNASIKLGSDLQLAANAGTAGSVDAAYGQMDMSGGYVQVGQYTAIASHFGKNFLIGDAGRGVFTMTGGSVLVGGVLDMSHNAVSSASFTMKDPITGPTGVPFTFTARQIDTRSTSTPDATLNSDILIDSDDARFYQKNLVNTGTGLTVTGTSRIGTQGKSTFEIKRGQVFLGQPAVLGVDQGINIDLSANGTSRATLKLSGGKLTLGSSLMRTNTTAATFPVISLTGGQLVLDSSSTTPTAMNWQADINIAGTQLTTRPGALMTLSVGTTTTHPGNFSMTSGSWDIDMSPGVGSQDALQDRIVMGYTTVPGTGSITGGTINLNYLGGYVPAIGDTRLIVRSATGGVSTLGAVTINAPGGDPNWMAVLANGNRDIRLQYVPEPSSCVLVALGLMMGLVGVRRKS